MSNRGVPIMIDGVHCSVVELGLLRLAGDIVGPPLSGEGSGRCAAIAIQMSMRRLSRPEKEWMREVLARGVAWWRQRKGIA